MHGMLITQHWIDASALIGDSTDHNLDFAMAVHLSIFWAQDMTPGVICPTAHPPVGLTGRLCHGLPLSTADIAKFGDGLWPLPNEAFSLDALPAVVNDSFVGKTGAVSWRLSPNGFFLRRYTSVRGGLFLAEILIRNDVSSVVIRHRVMHFGSVSSTPGVPRIIKLLSATRGIYDGGERMLPIPRPVHTEEQVKRLIKLLQSDQRRQPVTVAVQAETESGEQLLDSVTSYAETAFSLQHTIALSTAGAHHLRRFLGDHSLPDGSIKTFYPGFTPQDTRHHPVTAYTTITQHHDGRAGILRRLRIQLMRKEAWDRRAD